MAILEYVPPLKKITDNRTQSGDYYRAACDVCGTEFYPKRRTAKYCTPNCKVIQFRLDVANGKITKEIKKSTKSSNLANGSIAKKTQKPSKKPQKTFETFKNDIGTIFCDVRGAANVYEYLKSRCETHGSKEDILEACRSLKLGSEFEFEKHKIYRHSTQNYTIIFDPI